MHLQADQYERIVTQLRSEHKRERRGAPRVGLRAKIDLIPCCTGAAARLHTVWLRDLSASGIGFIFHEALAVGTYVVIALPRAAQATLDMLFYVARCSPLSNGQFSIGARFERVITEEDLEPQPPSP